MVSPYFKAGNFISLISLCCDHYNRNICLLLIRLNYFCNIKSVNSWEHKVKDYKVVIIFFNEIKGVFTAARGFYAVAVLRKVIVNKLKNILFVVNYKNFFFHINGFLILW